MFTKKDLFWLVKEQYPNVQIGKSLADYKEAVFKVLGSKFELSDNIMTNNLQFKKFVRMFCETISRLLKKFSKNYFAMVDSKNHQEFFGKEITVQMLTVVPGPPHLSEPNHKGKFSVRNVSYALSFYRSQNVWCRSKFFEAVDLLFCDLNSEKV